MATKNVPFQWQQYSDYQKLLSDAQIPPIQGNFSYDFMKLIENMLNKEPFYRPTATLLLSLPIFYQFKPYLTQQQENNQMFLSLHQIDHQEIPNY